MKIYGPSDDSYFFEEFLEDYFKKLPKKDLENFRFLDMGSGSGILARKALEFLKGENVLGVDINSLAISNLKKEKINCLKSDLFSKLDRGEKFDLIVFNAPYLPKDSREPKDSRVATTGGEKGDEISVRFIRESRGFLKNNGVIFLLVSSLTPLENLKKLGGKIVKSKKISYEELIILKF